MIVRDNVPLITKTAELGNTIVATAYAMSECDFNLRSDQEERLNDQLNEVIDIMARFVKNLQLVGGYIKLDNKEEEE